MTTDVVLYINSMFLKKDEVEPLVLKTSPKAHA